MFRIWVAGLDSRSLHSRRLLNRSFQKLVAHRHAARANVTEAFTKSPDRISILRTLLESSS
jgi:hypothetical protein